MTPSLLDQLDHLVGGMATPPPASFEAQVLPAPMRMTWDEQRAAQGPTFTPTITREAERFIQARREARDAAAAQVAAAYRIDKKPGALDRRDAALAAIHVPIPDRRAAEERAALAAAIAVQEVWDSVLAELRALYPNP